MSGHTPGPWTLAPCSHGGLLLQRGAPTGGRFVHPQHSLQIVPEADARLIAAAPDLLEACREVVRLIEHPQSTVTMPRTHKMLVAAIAKAEGR